MAAAERFTFFWGREHVLSQWHPCVFVATCPFEPQGALRQFKCAEQWMMFCKAHLMGDAATGELIMTAPTPSAIKALGRAVRNWDQRLWDMHAMDIVVQGNRHKFGQNARLKQALLATGDTVLAEASPFDKIWGIGLRASDPRAAVRAQWRGKNLLGAALMQVRGELRSLASQSQV